ncbi:hypothetical protein KSD_56690 [Ktedonobacter sp. SOSP1-85]|uniref:PAS domain S-box protein n=1 Tax=Ktedonobacter sp. SOSP1-85 TaxID=2778367 RepID=UPI0019169BC5|nr:PAS domain S-box protein [Ktedonobacter sp. SOSP1-85]GHO77898.1 hypothetical protein KSD_56690 [Ktedonobacter sp. SOSP1-85]
MSHGEDVNGNNFWCSAPHLVSPALYQAAHKTKQTRESTEVEYVSLVTRNWLHVQLTPTVGGLVLHVHEKREPLPRQETCFPDEHLAADVLENMYVGVGFLTPEGILLDINEAPLADAQIRREEVIGKPFAQTPWWTFYPASQDQLRAAIARASRGETVRFETLVHPREGMDLHLEATVIPHKDVNHHVEYLVYVGTDITERKRAEGEIHALIDAIPQQVWIGRPDGSVDSFNQRWRDYTGLSTEEGQRGGWIHPEDRQRDRFLWQHAAKTGEVYETEHRIRHGATGAYRWFLTRAMPIRDETGQIIKWLGTCTDTEDQKRAEQQLKESRENWRVLAETVPHLVWAVRSDGRLEYANQRAYNYLGASPESMLGEEWQQFLHREDYERVEAVRRHALETGEPYEIEYRLKENQTGAYRWFLDRALPVRDETGQVVKWLGTSTDIEERKRTEEALRESQERVNILMNSRIIGIFFAEGEQIVDANDTYLRMIGYTREDLCEGSINWMRMTPPEYLTRTQQARQELVVQQYGTPYEKEYVCKDGSRLPVIVGAVALRRDPLLRTIGFVLDNTARKELEQRKDNFISMASHELRNPLTALKLQTTLLHRQLAKQGTQVSVSALSSMETQINKVTRLVEELLDVSKIQAGKLEYRQEPVDLDALLREITDTMQYTHPSHTIVVHGAAHSSLLGDRDRLGQVFINLLSNAIKYSPSAQTVEMDLSASAEMVTIRVHDYGLGIPREQRDKIFERFYRVLSAKQRAIPGLGMGLYIVAEIVKHHGGTISVESDVGKGSTFTITLPTRREA